MSTKAKRLVLLGTAAFAMIWAIARACVQSISADEAGTYVNWIATKRLFFPSANNHILNTVLMWLFTQTFGTSELTVRLPALIGAALYITASYRVCRLLSPSLTLQLALFVCLVYNPFIFDYLVVARGYALALGFLMWAVVAPASWFLNDAADRPCSLATACAVSSACIGLSVAANFAFAFVDFVTIILIFLLASRRRNVSLSLLFICCWLPLAIVTLSWSGPFMLHFPKKELWWGATSLGETFSTIMEASFYRLPFDFGRRPFFAQFIWFLLGATSLAWFTFVLFRRDRNSPFFRLAIGLAVVIAVTVMIHWTAFCLFGLLLPRGRTASYFFPLSMLAVGSLAAIPSPSCVARYLRGSVVVVLLVMAMCFLLCLRLTYFEEWQWNADVKEVYAILDCMGRNSGVKNVSACWCYVYPLNFYRLQSKHSLLSEVLDDRINSSDAQAYVFNTLLDTKAVRDDDPELKIIYRGRPLPGGVGNTVIAVKQELAQSILAGPCIK
jgi:hypothetical protein